jgi:hypothetical protein
MALRDRLRKLEDQRRDIPDWPRCDACGGYCDLKLRTFTSGVEDVEDCACPNRDARLDRYALQRSAFNWRTGRVAAMIVPPKPPGQV